MGVNLFILGRPGSGKSTVARQICTLAQEQRWLAVHMDDYNILYQMFKADTKQQRFRSTLHNGFDVIDSSVLNEALNELAEKIRKLTRPLERNRLVIIEFAPTDYRTALRLFRHELLNNTYVLMLYADIETCIQRKHRVDPSNPNNHFVSEEIMRTYYSHNDIPDIKVHLESEYGITKERSRIIDNTDPSMSFFKETVWFAKYIFERETIETEKLPSVSISTAIDESVQQDITLKETGPISVVIPVDESTDL